MYALTPIESWSESHVRSRHKTNRSVLAERDDKRNGPDTWVREVGQACVFYIAWDCGQRTGAIRNLLRSPHFVELIESGWAVADDEL